MYSNKMYFAIFMMGCVFFTHSAFSQQDYLAREYQRYAQIPHPADDPYVSIPQTQTTQIQKSLLTNESTLALRGNIEMIFQAEQTNIQVLLSKRDINVAEGEDEISFTVYSAFDEPIITHTLGDDGNSSNDAATGPSQSETFTVELPATGIYVIRTDTSRDLLYDIAVSSQQSALISTLEFIDGSKTTDLYFQAPADQVSFNVLTHHFNGFPQTLRIHDSNDQVVERLFVDDISTNFQVVANVPEEEVGKVWRLHIQKQDLILQSSNVQYWFRSPGEFFDIVFTQQLLQLRVLEMSGLPGMRIPFRFEMENIRSADITVYPEFEHLSGFEMEMEPYASSMTIASASRRLPYFYGNIPQDTNPGDTSEFLLTLKDEGGRTIVSSKINVDVVEQKPLDPDTQFLFFTPQRLDEIRRSGLGGAPYQLSIYNSIQRSADQIVEEGLLFPDEASHWRGYYICDGIGDGNDDPNDGTGASLIFDPLQPGVYICSLDGERYEGERYRRGWLGEYYFEMFNRISTVGTAYNLEPKPAYAEYLRTLLLDISDKYRSFRLDDYQGNVTVRSARMMTETLGEAMGLYFILPAYDAVRDSEYFSDEDRAHIEWNFIRPAVEIIEGNLMGITNWQSWHNSAIGLAGFLLDDRDMIDVALHGPNGHDYVRDVSIREDGLWQEGSVGYHFFAMVAMNLLLEAMEAHGLDPFDAKIELAYSSILDIMQPDGQFPALNDSQADYIQWRAAHYEIANAHYDNPKFDEILRFIYETRGYGRGTSEAMLFGKAYEDIPLQIDSTVKEYMGLASLRSGTGLNDQVALMDYGPQGDFHGHLDKLNVTLYGAGEEWLPDLGTYNTNSDLYTGWFRTTLGHNTIMIGEQPQGVDTETERPIRFYHDSFPEMQIMQAEFGAPVYPDGTNVRRTVITSGDEYSIIIDDVEGTQDPVDFIYHLSGEFGAGIGFEALGGADGWERNLSGYRYLLPPNVYNLDTPTQILQQTTSDIVSIQAFKQYGFTDPLETIEDWSGNINLSEDAVEGDTSLSWVIVPRSFQSIGKSFETLNEVEQVPDRITFQYKIEANTFEYFTMQLIDMPNFSASNWIIAFGDEVTPNEWMQADIDLASPDFFNGTNLQFKQIQFAIYNANQYEGAFKVFIDNIQAWKDGELLEPEERGLAVFFPQQEETQYFMADGPSIVPPRTHPVIIARRDGSSSRRMVSLIKPFFGEVGGGLDFTSNRIGALTDWVQIDTDENRYIRYTMNFDLNYGRNIFDLDMLGYTIFEDTYSPVHYRSSEPAEISTRTTFNGAITVEYQKNNSIEDRLIFRRFNQQIETVLIDGEMYSAFQELIQQNGDIDLHILNLPQGNHQIEIMAQSTTTIQSWELY